MKKSKINTELRHWARGVSFTIAMGRRQVYTLVSLHISAERKWGIGNHNFIGDRHKSMRSFVTSTNCLVDRGLVIPHVWLDKKLIKDKKDLTVGNLWQLSRAGELVIELLKEAGVYEEVKTELEDSEKLDLRIA